jgi:hypothetical protein
MAFFLASCGSGPPPVNVADFNGRWNIRVANEDRSRAWWLEVEGAGTDALKGKFVGAPGGGLYDIPEISIRDGELVFAFTRKYSLPGEKQGYQEVRTGAGCTVLASSGEIGRPVRVEGHLDTGFTRRFSRSGRRQGRRYVEGRRSGRPFQRKDLSGWKAMVTAGTGLDRGEGHHDEQRRANNLVSEEVLEF